MGGHVLGVKIIINTEYTKWQISEVGLVTKFKTPEYYRCYIENMNKKVFLFKMN